MSKFENRPRRTIEKGTAVFFENDEKKTESEKETAIDYDEKIRQTFYVTRLQKRALALMSAHEQIDISEIVREALEAYIPNRYKSMVYTE